MKLLKGKKIAEEILKELKKKIKSQGLKPGLAVVLIGKNNASEIYARLKKEAAKKVGIAFYLFRFSSGAKESKIISKINKLSCDSKIHGIIIQLPLSKNFNAQKIINAISPEKDADGFHPENLNLFLKGKGKINPVFPKAIMKLLESIKNLKNKKAIILSRSEKFGKIMLVMLERKGISAGRILLKKINQTSFYTRCRPTLNVEELKKIKNSDIIISAVGKSRFIKGEMVKKGVIIIDGGITKKGKKVLGDVDYRSVKNIAGYLSPVPGGVGPVTVACLLENVYLSSTFKK